MIYFGFPVHTIVIYYIVFSIKCAIALSLKIIYISIKNILLLKFKLSSDLAASHTIFAGGGSCFDIGGCWWIRMVVDEGWGGYTNFLK